MDNCIPPFKKPNRVWMVRMGWIFKTIDSFRGVIPGGGWGGGGAQPPNFWPTALFSGFSHTTDRKVPSEVVLMGSVMSDKTAIFQLKSQ